MQGFRDIGVCGVQVIGGLGTRVRVVVHELGCWGIGV